MLALPMNKLESMQGCILWWIGKNKFLVSKWLSRYAYAYLSIFNNLLTFVWKNVNTVTVIYIYSHFLSKFGKFPQKNWAQLTEGPISSTFLLLRNIKSSFSAPNLGWIVKNPFGACQNNSLSKIAIKRWIFFAPQKNKTHRYPSKTKNIQSKMITNKWHEY